MISSGTVSRSAQRRAERRSAIAAWCASKSGQIMASIAL